jgi:hypothetical protein
MILDSGMKQMLQEDFIYDNNGQHKRISETTGGVF